MNLKIALLQLQPTGTPEGQLEKGLAACRQAKAAGADIALFPEMWNNGYTIPRIPQGFFPWRKMWMEPLFPLLARWRGNWTWQLP